jgi:predicted ABC-type ATPase
MAADAFVITVVAGVNGAGKSSVGGAALEDAGSAFFNPDLAAKEFRRVSPALSATQANALAWTRGKELLEAAIARRTSFNFETTLGGNTITSLLIAAAAKGATVNVWYAGLASVELHLQRVASRVRKGGHPIPEADIRRRWIGSHLNLIKLLPHLTNLRVFDNSIDRDPLQGLAPELRLVLSITNRRIAFPGRHEVQLTPDWAKSIVVAAFNALRL